MASITIRKLDMRTHLSARAADHSRSGRGGAHHPVREAVSDGKAGPRDLRRSPTSTSRPFRGIVLELPTRGSMREPLDFA